MSRRKSIRRLPHWATGAVAIVALVLVIAPRVAAWVSDRSWPAGTQVVMQFNLGSSPTLIDGCPNWNCVGAAALGSWNLYFDRLRFGWTTNPDVTTDRRDNVNAVVFSDKAQGETLNFRTLGVTIAYFLSASRRMLEADVVFNRNQDWNSYRGRLRGNLHDFRRTAIHEFGHVVGFQHPDDNGQVVAAIMNSTDSDIDDLVLDDIKGAHEIYGVATAGGQVPFPPRNETRDFRFALDDKYRTGLGRGFIESYVDVEGAVVWTQEYLRYRINGCTDEQARGRVRWQILATVAGQAAPPACGQASSFTAFPPRNETYTFRTDLERIYRDDLQRGTIKTTVDAEGDVVWIQEYVRYRLSGCSDAVATEKVFRQIDGFGVQPAC